jgi:hypothetical protein
MQRAKSFNTNNRTCIFYKIFYYIYVFVNIKLLNMKKIKSPKKLQLVLFLIILNIIGIRYESHSQNCTYIANAGPDQSICPSPGSVQIGSTPINGVKYSWSPVTGLSNPNIANPIASPTTTTTYTLTTTENNLIQNGDFEFGNTGFNTDYTYAPPTPNSVFAGNYTIGTNPSLIGPWCNIPDHTSDGFNMLIVDGLQNSQPNNNFWSQNVSVTPNTNYLLSVWFYSLGHLNIDPYWPLIQIKVNGNIVVDNYVLPYNNCQGWVNLKIPINVGSLSNALIEMKTLTFSGYTGGNDFAVDDISLACVTTDDVTVCVCSPTPPPEIVTVQIPLRHSFVYFKQDPAYAISCALVNGQPYPHGHFPLNNSCDYPYLLSGYLQCDNNLPCYQAFNVDFYMGVSTLYGTNIHYLDFVGHNLDLYEPCLESDIISTKLNLFPYTGEYCKSGLGYINEIGIRPTPHSGVNPFSVKRTTLNTTFRLNCNSITYNYDNTAPTSNEVINIPSSTNLNQPYNIDVTQMIKNAVSDNTDYIGFLIKQTQFNNYNNVLFNGLKIFDWNVQEGEPFIEIKYTRKYKANSCNQNSFVEYKTKIADKYLYETDMPNTRDVNNNINGDLSNVSIYPNPTTTQVTISAINNSLIQSVEIGNLFNPIIKRVVGNNNKTSTINVSTLLPGIYNCKITTNKGVEYQKLIIKR